MHTDSVGIWVGDKFHGVVQVQHVGDRFGFTGNEERMMLFNDLIDLRAWDAKNEIHLLTQAALDELDRNLSMEQRR